MNEKIDVIENDFFKILQIGVYRLVFSLVHTRIIFQNVHDWQ